MDSIHFIISVLTLSLFALSLLLPGPRYWYQAVRRKPFAAFLIVISIAAVFLGNPRGARMLADDPLDTLRTLRIIFLSFMAGLAILAVLLARNRSHSGPSLIWMTFYALLATISSIYSKFPLLSLYKGFEVCTYVALGFLVAGMLHTRQDIQDILDIMLLAMWYLILSALIGALLAPSEAWPRMESTGSMAFALQGVFPAVNSNTLTQISGIVACCTICSLFRVTERLEREGITPIVLFISTIIMVMAHSRTSLLAFVIATCVVFVNYRKVKLALVTTSLAGLFALFTTLGDLVLSYVMRGQHVGLFTSLSGRTHFWPLVTKRFFEEPLCGHGFYASQRLMFGISSVDNTYLEVLLGLGILGFAILCFAVIGVFSSLWRSRLRLKQHHQPEPYHFVWCEIAVFFVFLLIRSLTGPSFQVLHIDLTFFILVTVCASAALRIITETSSGDSLTATRQAKGLPTLPQQPDRAHRC